MTPNPTKTHNRPMRIWTAYGLLAALAITLPGPGAALLPPASTPNLPNTTHSLFTGTWYLDHMYPLQASVGAPATLQYEGEPSPDFTTAWSYDVQSTTGLHYRCAYDPDAGHTQNVGTGTLRDASGHAVEGRCKLDVPPDKSIFAGSAFAAFSTPGICFEGEFDPVSCKQGPVLNTYEFGRFHPPESLPPATPPASAVNGLGKWWWDTRYLGQLELSGLVGDESTLTYDNNTKEWLVRTSRGDILCYRDEDTKRVLFLPASPAWWPLAGTCDSHPQRAGNASWVNVTATFPVGFTPDANVQGNVLVAYASGCGTYLATGTDGNPIDLDPWLEPERYLRHDIRPADGVYDTDSDALELLLDFTGTLLRDDCAG